MRAQVNLLAALQALFGLLHLAAAVAIALPLLGLGAFLGRHVGWLEALASGTLGLLVAVVAAGGGVSGLLLSWGLVRRQQWARLATILVSLPGLLVVPTGTVLSMYSLWLLTSDEATDLFLEGPREARVAVRGPTTRAITLTWAGSAALLALTVGGLRWSVAVAPVRTGAPMPPGPVAAVAPEEAPPAPAPPPERAPAAPRAEAVREVWYTYRTSEREVVVVEGLDAVPEAYRSEAVPVR